MKKVIYRKELTIMNQTAWIFSYKLKKGVDEKHFIELTQKLHDEVISKAKGFISWEHYLQKDTWTDFVLWETEEDAKNATTVGKGKEVTKNFNNYAWRSDLSKIEIIDDKHFIEYTKNNYPTYFTITSKEKLKEYKFDIENTNIKGKWIGIFKRLDNGNVLLDFTEKIETNNFIMKLLAKPYLKREQKRYMKDLEKELSK